MFLLVNSFLENGMLFGIKITICFSFNIHLTLFYLIVYLLRLHAAFLFTSLVEDYEKCCDLKHAIFLFKQKLTSLFKL